MQDLLNAWIVSPAFVSARFFYFTFIELIVFYGQMIWSLLYLLFWSFNTFIILNMFNLGLVSRFSIFSFSPSMTESRSSPHKCCFKNVELCCEVMLMIRAVYHECHLTYPEILIPLESIHHMIAWKCGAQLCGGMDFYLSKFWKYVMKSRRGAWWIALIINRWTPQ